MAARKKTARKKTARKTSPRKGTDESALVTTGASSVPSLPSSLADRFGEIASREEANIHATGGGWPFITTTGGTFTHPQQGDLGPEMDVVVMGSVRANFYYGAAYDAAKRGEVLCYAMSEDADMPLAPPSNLASKQSEACLGCEWDAFGSDDRGKGKACRNYFVISVIPAFSDDDLDPATIAKAQGARVRIPPTSLPLYTGWCNKIKTFKGRPRFTFLSRLTIVKDAQTMFKVHTDIVDLIQEEDVLLALSERYDEAQEQVLMAPPVKAASESTAARGSLQRPQRRQAKAARGRGRNS